MTTPAEQRNIAGLISPGISGACRATAGGTGDATAVTGATIDRRGYDSVKLVIGWQTTLQATKTLSIAAEYQESDDDSTWDTAVALQASTVVKTGACTEAIGTTQFTLDLTGKKRYIRFNFTPDISTANTDTAQMAAVHILGGAANLPA